MGGTLGGVGSWTDPVGLPVLNPILGAGSQGSLGQVRGSDRIPRGIRLGSVEGELECQVSRIKPEGS